MSKTKKIYAGSIHANVKKQPEDTIEQTLYIILEAYKDVHYKNADRAINNILEVCRGRTGRKNNK